MNNDPPVGAGAVPNRPPLCCGWDCVVLAKRDENGPPVACACGAFVFEADCEFAPTLLNRLPPKGAFGAEAGG